MHDFNNLLSSISGHLEMTFTFILPGVTEFEEPGIPASAPQTTLSEKVCHSMNDEDAVRQAAISSFLYTNQSAR